MKFWGHFFGHFLFSALAVTYVQRVLGILEKKRALNGCCCCRAHHKFGRWFLHETISQEFFFSVLVLKPFSGSFSFCDSFWRRKNYTMPRPSLIITFSNYQFLCNLYDIKRFFFYYRILLFLFFKFGLLKLQISLSYAVTHFKTTILASLYR